MQIHINGGGDFAGTVFAFNHFNDGSVADLGIGNQVGGFGPDWTLAQNANAYSARKMKVYVSGASLESTIGDANGYQLVYELNIPAKPTYKDAKPQYSVMSIPDQSFTRIAYLLELDTDYVWVSVSMKLLHFRLSCFTL